MSDFTKGWTKHERYNHWRHPSTTITIHHTDSGYFFSYDKGPGPLWYCMFHASLESAAEMVQHVMDGPAGKYNQCPR